MLDRIREGSIPQQNTTKKYDISNAEVNAIRKEGSCRRSYAYVWRRRIVSSSMWCSYTSYQHFISRRLSACCPGIFDFFSQAKVPEKYGSQEIQS